MAPVYERWSSSRRYDEPMTSQLRVLVEQPTRDKRWVAIAADWPGLERGGKTDTRRSRSSPATSRDTSWSRSAPGWARSSRPRPTSTSSAATLGRLDRLLGHLVRALTARPRAVRRANIRPPGAAAARSVGRVRRDGRPRLGGPPAGCPGRRPLPRPDRPACPRDRGWRLLEAREGTVRAGGPSDAGRARPSPRPLRRGDARLVRRGQAESHGRESGRESRAPSTSASANARWRCPANRFEPFEMPHLRSRRISRGVDRPLHRRCPRIAPAMPLRSTRTDSISSPCSSTSFPPGRADSRRSRPILKDVIVHARCGGLVRHRRLLPASVTSRKGSAQTHRTNATGRR